MAVYNTTILGAGKIIESKKILVYSTKSFIRLKNSMKIGDIVLSESESVLEMLSNIPTRSNVDIICDKILSIHDLYGDSIFSTIDNISTSPDYLEFLVNNSERGLVKDDGFNIIIYLDYDGPRLRPLGFSHFLKLYGDRITSGTESAYSVKRDFAIETIDITVDIKNNISINDKIVKLLDGLNTDVEADIRDLVGDELYDYTSVEKAESVSSLFSSRSPSYSTDLLTILKNQETKYLFNDKFSNIPGSYSVKLSVISNIVLNTETDYNHFQFGYYEGDLVLYAWKDDLYYSVISLTKQTRLGNTYYYTQPFKISGTTVFSSFKYYTRQFNQESPRILGFSGQYVILGISGEKKLFDIFSQDEKEDETNSGWLNLPSFIIDRLDPSNKIYNSPKISYNSLAEAIHYFGFLQCINFNLKSFASRNSIKVISKLGSWVILDYGLIDAYILTDVTKTIFIRRSEIGNIVFVNSECIIIKDKVSEVETDYKLYDSPGYYISDSLKEYMQKFSISVPDFDLSSIKVASQDSRVKIMSGVLGDISEQLPISKPSIIQKSFLSYFRRNSLPESMLGFEIIGALSGIIFYKQGNSINYI